MRITDVKLKDWKGSAEHHRLGPLNLVVGPNGSGKTALMEAIQFACEGKCSLGDKPDAALPLMGLDGGAVAIHFDDGGSFSRGLDVDHHQHKVSSVVSISGKTLPAKTAQSVIAQTIGRDGEIFAPMFDLDRFLDLSDDKRRDYVLDLCARARGGGEPAKPTNSPSPATALSDRIKLSFLALVLGEGTVSSNADRPDALAFLIGKLGEAERQALGSAMTEVDSVLGAGGPAEAIAAALEQAKAMSNAARRAKDEGQAAARELSAQLDAFAVPAETGDALKDAQAKAMNERIDLLSQIAHQDGRRASRDRLLDQLARAKKSLTDLEMTPPPPPPNAAEAERLDAEAAALELAAAPIANLSELETAEQQTRQDLDEAQQGNSSSFEAVVRARAEAERLEASVKRGENDDWTQLAAMCEPIEVQPHCVAAWGHLRRFVANRMAVLDLHALRKQLAEAQERFAAANADYDRAGQRLAAAKNDHHSASGALAAARGAAAEASQAGARRAEQARKLRDEAQAVRFAAVRHAEKRTSFAEQVEIKRQAIVAAESELNRLDADGGFVPAEPLKDQVAALERTIEELRQRIDTKIKYQALRDEYATCLTRAEQQGVAWEVGKQLAEAIRIVRESLMFELVIPLVTYMNDFNHIHAGDECYCRLLDDRENRVFELGIIRGDRRISLPALSGGERVLFSAALAYALVQLAQPKLRLLMIEAAEADAETIDALLVAIQGLRSNLDTVLVVTCHSGCEPAECWDTISLYSDEQEEAVA